MFELLFLGNSYTFVNELDVVTASALVAGAAPEATATRLAEGGYTWALHLDQTETEGTAWNEALVDPGNAWEWVILQEQSQIPGFPHTDPSWTESVDAGAALDAYAAGLGAETVLMMTWGRRLGDADNPDLYPDFLTMQAALTDGYLTYRDQFSTETRPVWVAPVGLAFEAVYTSVAAEGQTPEDDGTLFSLLYQEDGSHPSPAGTWLAAWVIYATITGESPIGLPIGSLPEDDATRLQEIADTVVLGNAAGLSYPWSDGSTDPTDTGPTDSGPADSGGPDTDPPGGDDSATDVTTGAPADGCGCAASTPGAADGLALVSAGLLLTRRRRRP